MASPVASLLACLAGTQSGDGPTRSAAETQLATEWPSQQLGVLLALIATKGCPAEMAEACALFSPQQHFGQQPVNLEPNDDHPHAVSMRQLAAILLRQYVTQYWSPAGEHFVGPEPCSAGEKAEIRNILNPQYADAALRSGLRDSEPRVRLAVAMAISAIAQWDVPMEWPDLLQSLLHVLREANAALEIDVGARAARTGCIRCLTLITESELLGDDGLASMLGLPGLFDELLVVFQTGADGSGDALLQRDRALAVRVLTSVVRWLALVKDSGDSTVNVIQPFFEQILPNWVPAAVAELNRSDPADGSAAGSDCAVKIALLVLLSLLLGEFPKRSRQLLPHLIAPLWQVLGGDFVGIYEALVVHSSDDSTALDEEGDPLGREMLAVHALAFIRTCFERKATRNVFFATMGQSQAGAPPNFEWVTMFTELCLTYMQVSQTQVERWEDDANQYVVDEDEEWGVRPFALHLVREVCGMSRDGTALRAALIGVANRLAETDASAETALQQVGTEAFDKWWKLREACHYCMSGLSKRMAAHEQAISDAVAQQQQSVELPFSLLTYTTQVVGADLSRASNADADDGFAFLTGAGLRCASNGLAGIDRDTAMSVLQFSAEVITSQQDHSNHTAVCMDLGACRVVAKLCQLSREAASTPGSVAPLAIADLEAYVASLLSGILALFASATSDTLHLYLDTLAEVSVLAPQVTQQYAETLLPYVLSVWMHNIKDRLIFQASLDLLKAVAMMPSCVGSCIAHILPVCNTILTDSHELSGLTAGAVELCGMLVKSVHTTSTAGSAAEGYISIPPDLLTTVGTVITVVSASDDASILQEGCDAMTQLVQAAGGAALLATPALGPAGEETNFLQLCVGLVDALLAIHVSDTSALQVGPLISTLIRHAGDQLAQDGLSHILLSVCGRLGFASLPSLRQHLICVFARLVMTHPDVCLGFLAGHTVEVSVDSRAAYQAQQQKWAQLHGHEDPNVAPIQVPTESRNALQFVAQTWLDTHEDFQGAYYLKLSVLALCRLIEIALGIPPRGEEVPDPNERAVSQQSLGLITVLGEETETSKNTKANSRMQTRSRGPIEVSRVEEQFVARALSVVLREFSVATEHEGVGDSDEDYYDDESDSDDEFDDGDDGYAAFVSEMAGTGNFADAGHAMAALGFGSDELGLGIRWDDTEDALDPEAEADTLGISGIAISAYVPDWIHTVLSTNADAVHAMQTVIGPSLNPVDQQILQGILSSPPGSNQ